MFGHRPLAHRIGFGLMLAATIFWLWFGIGSALGDFPGPLNWGLYIFVPVGLFVMSILIALRWPGVCGYILIIEGLVAVAFLVLNYRVGGLHAGAFVPMLMALALPPLCAGLLFFSQQRRTEEQQCED